MSAEDRLAILEAIGRYSHTYDAEDVDAYAALFAEDGVFDIFIPGAASAAVRLQSRGAIREWAARRLQARGGRFTSRHHQSGTVFDELTPDTAVTRTLVLVTHQDAGGGAPRPVISGTYEDRWRKTPAGWRLARRAAYVDRDPGSLA